jgi:molybdopterin/thiamine biosynthesis adenylyltransferase
MVPWFLRDPERLQLERTGIEDLSRSASWLVGVEWRIDGQLCLNAVIRAHGHDYEVRLSFPSLYPDVPSVVRPLNMNYRISTHQYGGADGPLCLEWGPDNWNRNVTAVQMLESAYRLFHIENPLGEDRPEVPVVAPSRHQLTVGQELRGKWARWYVSDTLAGFLAGQPRTSIGRFKFSFRQIGETWVSIVHEAYPLNGDGWIDNQIPTTLPGAETKDQYIGIWFKTTIDKAAISQAKNLTQLKAILVDFGSATYLATDGTSPVEGFNRSIASVLVMDGSGEMHLFVVLSGNTAIKCSNVKSALTAVQSRSPQSNDLHDKTVGIVGLGSAGSKIAMSLARMGLRKFYLVDHDVLLPENLQRHALDWQGVIQHKVDGMKVAIDLVAPGAQVDVCRLHISGQESNASVSGALDRLAKCDLLIDATAISKVFNLLASIARTAMRPMIWVEVFGGGIGGLVARSRPGIDPIPQDMRGAYLQYCAENEDTSLKSSSANYEVETAEGDVLVASDSDVAIIAHHAVQFVPDCLIPPERARFPYSMYLIGLAKGWVFEAPFATIPISMTSYTVAGWGEDNKEEFGKETIDFLLGLVKKNDNATDSSTGNSITAD